MQEQAWKTCWKLCQNLYDSREDPTSSHVRPTLDLCRDFCQALFEVRVRENEAADSVLRVSFELNNHLFNTHDRSLPEAFRERTLDFYITLCHRLMKQNSRLAEETDSLLRACWSLAEMLFSLRQNKREGRRPDEELLGARPDKEPVQQVSEAELRPGDADTGIIAGASQQQPDDDDGHGTRCQMPELQPLSQ